MVNLAVVKTGGKQYLVKEGDLLTVDKLENKEKESIELETLATFDDEGKKVEVGNPALAKKVKAEVVVHGRGDKIRIAKFKSKVRYRKVRGFRSSLTTIKIGKI